MLRLILSIVLGVIVAFAVVFATDALFHSFASSAAPMPTDMTDEAAIQAYVATLPVGLLAAIIAGWTLAAFAGSSLAAHFARKGPWPGWVVTGVFLAATVANFFMVTHPVWMVAASVVLIVAAGGFGARVGTQTSRSFQRQG